MNPEGFIPRKRETVKVKLPDPQGFFKNFKPSGTSAPSSEAKTAPSQGGQPGKSNNGSKAVSEDFSLSDGDEE